MLTPDLSDELLDPSDAMRGLAELTEADPRMRHFAMRDGNSFRPIAQSDRWDSIDQFGLLPTVPKGVRIHFDTARNLYLHAWFVYRFHVIAEQQALVSLEMALRVRLTQAEVLDVDGLLVKRPSAVANARSKGPRRQPGMRLLLDLAVKFELINNDRIASRERWAQTLAEHRVSEERIAFMLANSVEQMAFEDLPATPNDDERKHDWISAFVETLPSIRNDYAHGSERLHATVLRTFDIVSDLINQLFTASTAEAPSARPVIDG